MVCPGVVGFPCVGIFFAELGDQVCQPVCQEVASPCHVRRPGRGRRRKPRSAADEGSWTLVTCNLTSWTNAGGLVSYTATADVHMVQELGKPRVGTIRLQAARFRRAAVATLGVEGKGLEHSHIGHSHSVRATTSSL